LAIATTSWSVMTLKRHRAPFFLSLISEQYLALCRQKAGNDYFRMAR